MNITCILHPICFVYEYYIYMRIKASMLSWTYKYMWIFYTIY